MTLARLTFAIVLLAAPAAAATQTPLERIDAAGTMIDKGDDAGARDTLVDLLSAPRGLSPYEYYFCERLLALAFLDLGDHPAALAPARFASQTQWADSTDWVLRVRAAAWTDDYDDASASIVVLARKWPDKLNEVADTTIGHVTAHAAEAVSEDRAYALFQALDAAKWAPNNRFLTLDELYLEMTRYALERGEMQKAKTFALRVDAADMIVAIRADKRFDAVVAGAPDHFDVAKALDRNLAKARADAAAEPDKLQGAVQLAATLNTLGREGEALSTVDAALARIRAGHSFSDQDEKISWAYDTRAVALIGLGRRNEAARAMAKGALFEENGEPNVSQAINLADVYNGMGRPRDALASVARIELNYPSPYGRMALQSARVCSYAQLGESKKVAPLLVYLKAHAADGEKPLLSALMCARDFDGAAALVTAGLDDPAKRGKMLAGLQHYLPRPEPFAPDYASRMAALCARPDIRAKIAEFGRVESYPMTGY